MLPQIFLCARIHEETQSKKQEGNKFQIFPHTPHLGFICSLNCNQYLKAQSLAMPFMGQKYRDEHETV